MNRHRLACIVLIGAAFGQIAWYYPLLPATVASHFDALGRPNGWMRKEAFVGIYLAVMTLNGFLFTVFPGLIRRFPDDAINLPNKDYWFAPARREAALAKIAGFLYEFGAPTLALLIVVFHLSFRANLDHRPIDARVLWAAFGAYILYFALWIARFRRSFRLPR